MNETKMRNDRFKFTNTIDISFKFINLKDYDYKNALCCLFSAIATSSVSFNSYVASPSSEIMDMFDDLDYSKILGNG